MADTLIHLFLLALFPPLLLGVVSRTKAFFAGRAGPSVLQPYYDLARLLGKGMVLSTTTTWIFRVGPVVALAGAWMAGLFLPLGSFAAPLSFGGDFILFAYLLALGRFFTTLAALDTGSPFEGMGVARELTFACLAEPALFLAFLVLARISGSLELTHMLQAPLTADGVAAMAAVALSAAGLFVVLLAENCRIPVDDPGTHLELTMIHEVMVLDHSGPLLGAILYGAAVKFFLFTALILHFLAPLQGGGGWSEWGLFLAECLGLAILVGVVESIMARLQMRHVPTLLVAACLLCGFGFLLVLR